MAGCPKSSQQGAAKADEKLASVGARCRTRAGGGGLDVGVFCCKILGLTVVTCKLNIEHRSMFDVNQLILFAFRLITKPGVFGCLHCLHFGTELRAFSYSETVHNSIRFFSPFVHFSDVDRVIIMSL